jgi:hypothetical protein
VIVTLEPWHLMAVVMNIRAEDAEDFNLLGGSFDRQRWACERALAPGVAFAVLDLKMHPVACFGFIEDAPGRCTAWLVASDRWRCYVKAITKAFRIVAKEGCYRRIQALARPGRPGAAKFLKWLGFNLDGPMPGMCIDGGSMELYSFT